MKFDVAVTALAVCRQVISVDAENEEEAEKKALQEAENVGDAGWQLEGRFDDGTPVCSLAATEVGAEGDVDR